MPVWHEMSWIKNNLFLTKHSQSDHSMFRVILWKVAHCPTFVWDIVKDTALAHPTVRTTSDIDRLAFVSEQMVKARASHKTNSTIQFAKFDTNNRNSAWAGSGVDRWIDSILGIPSSKLESYFMLTKCTFKRSRCSLWGCKRPCAKIPRQQLLRTILCLWRSAS